MSWKWEEKKIFIPEWGALNVDINELVFSCIYCRHKIITTTSETKVHHKEKKNDDCKLYVYTRKRKYAKCRLWFEVARENARLCTLSAKYFDIARCVSVDEQQHTNKNNRNKQTIQQKIKI